MYQTKHQESNRKVVNSSFPTQSVCQMSVHFWPKDTMFVSFPLLCKIDHTKSFTVSHL